VVIRVRNEFTKGSQAIQGQSKSGHFILPMWVYVLQSESTGCYYCGHSNNPDRHPHQHNEPTFLRHRTSLINTSYSKVKDKDLTPLSSPVPNTSISLGIIVAITAHYMFNLCAKTIRLLFFCNLSKVWPPQSLFIQLYGSFFYQCQKG
jgi:hypothetical protein